MIDYWKHQNLYPCGVMKNIGNLINRKAEYEAAQQASNNEGDEPKTGTELVPRHTDTPMLDQINKWISSLGPKGATKNMVCRGCLCVLDAYA